MKSFGKYISRHLLTFAAVIIALVILNALTFGITFYQIIAKDYGEASPQNMLETAAEASSADGITEDARHILEANHIWAMYLDINGNCVWTAGTPAGLPNHYSLQDVALFSRGYLNDYPVFVRNTDDGLLVLGYPKDSYTKLTGNYLSLRTVRTLPIYITAVLAADILLLFALYYVSKRKIMRNTDPIIESIKALSDEKPVQLKLNGDLAEVADSINRASRVLSRQNEARANWISGVSHDIRTPLSMIMGYAARIEDNIEAGQPIREQAGIIRRQSVRIRELVQDLNLVSQLEYEMQPLHRERVRLSALLRSYTADLLNGGLEDRTSVELLIGPGTEEAVMECDARLITRAVGNLVQNSIHHNPSGCNITLALLQSDGDLTVSVRDNGVGLTAQKQKELAETPHYMESTDERLNLRHGLGLLLVRQITEAHGGSMHIENLPEGGVCASLTFRQTIRPH